MRRTRIVCTIGPASSSRAMLSRLLSAGMDVARLNFSHGTHEEHAAVIDRLRQLSARRENPLAILQDLSGPKVRIGVLPEGAVQLLRGQRVTFSTRPGAEGCIPLPVPELVAALGLGDRLLADDGAVELRVLSASATDVECRVVVPGVLSSRKGVTSPGVSLNIPAVTEKDLDDLRFGLAHGVDWVAASYVRGPEDLAPLRQAMDEAGIRRPIIAKIEKMEAVRRIEEILCVVDGVMVARGDLGVEIPIDEVPVVQKRIIRLCNAACKPVITATQMLESMIHNPRPTRAEVTDVANAILDGSDAVMLSGETAAGEHPVEAVKMMAKVAVRAEPLIPDLPAFGPSPPRPLSQERERGSRSPRTSHSIEVAEAVAHATVEIARSVGATAILCATTSGSTARLIARCRPDAAILAATPHDETFRRLALTWGVRPALIGDVGDSDEMMEASVAAVVARRLVKLGDRIVLTAGTPVGVVGNTNLIRVHRVGDPIRVSNR